MYVVEEERMASEKSACDSSESSIDDRSSISVNWIDMFSKLRSDFRCGLRLTYCELTGLGQ